MRRFDMSFESLIEEGDIDYARNAKDDIWTKGNEVLYNLCSDSPGHTDDQIIVAKVWLIGRSYAAAVERGRPTGTEDPVLSEDFYRKVVCKVFRDLKLDDDLGKFKNIAEENEKISLDNYLGKLKNVTDENKKISHGLSVHYQLVQALEKETKKCHRSFASKYLHFHAPDSFYIYDSIAARGLSRLLPGRIPKDAVLRDVSPEKSDEEYRRFVIKAHHLRDQIHAKFKKDLTPRQIDRLLLKKGGGEVT
jgi:hypothetical protein